MANEHSEIFHIAAHVVARDLEIDRFDVGTWLWRALRHAFPRALGACLMPDHLHLVTPLDGAKLGIMRLNRLIGHFERVFRSPAKPLSAADPVHIRGADKILRHLRYVALNPCRAGLTGDPLAWWFSTHRDVVGAVFDPWVTATALRRALRRPERGFIHNYHAYVSADPSTAVGGTPPPRTPARIDSAGLRLPVLSLGAVALAAAAATRASTEAIRLSGPTRIAFVLLAHEYGWTHQQQLAHACACSTRTIRNVLRDAYNLPDRAALMQAAHHCLADERLTRGARRREPCEPWTLPKKRKISA